ncbi:MULTISPECIES: YagU family protein [unclassified Lonepinella]|uniref:YagU family protein n=1 Tax=unclassified Lonepinella TaxID=2642006 RepID=UPI0036DC6C3A
MSGIFQQTEPSRRRYGLAVFVGIIAGIISAFVKWGAEHPFPPRSPFDLFTAACPQPVLDALNSGAIAMNGALDQCSRAFLNPPHVFLRDYIGIDPTEAAFTFADHAFNWIGVTHMIFSLVFAIAYCVVAERFPKVKFWQGIGAGIIANICAHYIAFPALGLTPPVAEWPLYEHISELVGHIFWFWTIEVIRRDLRNRITHEPDAEVPLSQGHR